MDGGFIIIRGRKGCFEHVRIGKIVTDLVFLNWVTMAVQVDVETSTIGIGDLLARDVDVSVEFFPDGLRVRVVLGAFHDFPVSVHLGAMNVADDHVGIAAITVRTCCADRSSEVGGP